MDTKARKTYKKLQVIKHSQKFSEAVEVAELPILEPKPNEVLIKCVYVGVNAADALTAAGPKRFPSSELPNYFSNRETPYDIGFEAIGSVEALGKDVQNLKLGQSVLYIGERAYAEYLMVDVKELFIVPELKPDYLSFAIPGLTAAISLDECGRIQKGEKVLITAAAGGTGYLAVQWAKMKGCYVIGTCSSAEKRSFLHSISCDRVLNYKEENIDEVLSKEFPEGIDVIWETIGGPTAEMFFKHLAIRGRIIILGSIGDYFSPSAFRLEDTVTQLMIKSKTIAGFCVTQYKHKFGEYLHHLILNYSNGKIKVKVDFGEKTAKGPFIGIESVPNAVEYLYAGQNCGKIVVLLHKQ